MKKVQLDLKDLVLAIAISVTDLSDKVLPVAGRVYSKS